MDQRTLFTSDEVDVRGRVVNVASVSQRSPFRYPGGKTWLVPHMRRWLRSRTLPVGEFIEPFAGGAIIGLTVAFEEYAQHITLVERDEEVAAVWHTVFSGGAEWLAEQIISFDLTIENVRAFLARTDLTREEIAFRTILKNRVNHGGILSPGSGILKYGEDGRGIKSRWYPETLSRRILDIATVAERVTFIEDDGLVVIQQHAADPNAVFFIDPPYTAGKNGKRAGRRLYTYFELDHEALFRLAASVRGDVLMTYDDSDEVRQLASHYGFQARLVAMKNTHHAKMSELLIGRNLEWVD